ncbi:hypothetical protein DM860_003203 [Cuscuta australis]|uniref:BHLH domain-containing protein n=1 Tax=Cuscuta australis TaxID=267555 RepID=A0A328D3M0_9ASTE|nr:hypothetical protein DM860_003203 [Cuscuta australis]
MDDDGGALDFFLWENQEWTIPISENPEENPGDHQGLAGSGGGGGSESHQAAPPPSAGRKRCLAAAADKDGGDNGSGVLIVESDHEVLHIWTERERRKKMRNMFSSLHALLPQLPPKADKSTIVDEAVSYITALQHTLHKLQKRKMEMLQYGFNFASPAAAAPSSSSLLPSRHKTTTMKTATTNPPAGSGGLLASLIGSLSTPPQNHYPERVVPRHPAASSFQTWTSPNVVLNVCGGDAQISLCCPKEAAAAARCGGSGSLLTEVCLVLEKHKIEVVSAQVSSDRHRSMVMIQARSGNGWRFHSETTSCSAAAGAEEIYKQAAAEITAWITTHACMHAM